MALSEDARIDIHDKFTVTDIRMRNYTKRVARVDDDGEEVEKLVVDSEKLITDLKRILAIIDQSPQVFMLKELESGQPKILYKEEYAVKQQFKSIIIVKAKKVKTSLNLWQFLKDNIGEFIYKTKIFYSKKAGPNVYQTYHGLPYQITENFDVSKISKWLSHVKNIICDGSDEVNEYILSWIANIIQHPKKRNGTVPILVSEQGIGKTTCFTDVICELLGDYAQPNITDSSNVICQFNSLIENMKLIVLNELSDKDNRKFNYDKFKSIVTDKFVDINEKGVKQRKVQNILNVIITTNNSNPIRIKDSDRRIIVINCSNRYANPSDNDPDREQKEQDNTDYFAELRGEIQTKGFYQQLFTFFSQRDITNFNSFKFPRTEARKELVETNKTCYETYIETHIDTFLDDFEKM
jgi:hypothetical protein